MKALVYLSIFAFLFRPMMAAPITLEWDANPPSEQIDGYRLYRVIADSQSEVLAEVSSTEATVDLEQGDTVFVPAFRGTEESQPSAPLTILPGISRVAGLRIKVTVEIETP
jgi:acetaldehyde dehydrogenase (acetylating)